MIIGKAGEYVKSIRDLTGAFVQISNKEQVDHRLLERVVTVIGNSANELLDGVQMVFAKLLLDPNQSSSVYTNISYHQVINKLNLHRTHLNSPPLSAASSLGASSLRSAAVAFSSADGTLATSSNKLGNTQVLQFLEGLRNTLKNNYNEKSIAEIMQASQVLAKYNFLGLGLDFVLAAVSQVTSCSSQQGGTDLISSFFFPCFCFLPNGMKFVVDIPFMSSSYVTDLNSTKSLSKNLSSPSAFVAVGSGRQSNVGFMGDLSMYSNSNESSSSFDYVPRESGGHYSGSGPLSASRDYASKVVKGTFSSLVQTTNNY